jgi:hypothetical protein
MKQRPSQETSRSIPEHVLVFCGGNKKQRDLFDARQSKRPVQVKRFKA